MYEYVPVTRNIDSLPDLDPDDSIIECPSLVTPFLIRRPNNFPPKIKPTEEVTVLEEIDKEGRIVNHEEQQSAQTTDSNSLGSILKTTIVASLTNPHQIKPMLTIPDYHRSSVGSFLIGIGISRANEWIIRDNIKKTKRAIRKEENCSDLIEELERQNEQLRQTNNNNKPFTFPLINCPHCDFKTESSIVLDGHLSYPHVSKREYKCNWCDFKTKDSKQITYHNHLVHKLRCFIDPPLQSHGCSFCPYESNSKAKFLIHVARCSKSFSESNLISRNQQQDESDLPAVTSKPISKEDINIYESTLKAIRLAAYNSNQQRFPTPTLQSKLIVVPRSNINCQNDVTFTLERSMNIINMNQSIVPVLNGEPRVVGRNLGQNVATYLSDHYPRRPPSNSVPIVNSLPGSSAQLLEMLVSGNNSTAKCDISQHKVRPSNFDSSRSLLSPTPPSISPQKINTLSNQQSSPKNNSKSIQLNLNDSLFARQGPNTNVPINIISSNLHLAASKNATFVICEICDGYIKDLEQLKTHMQWIHKVKIHQKMLESRPPLNCQKCQWRFFTDQGLERHLLGAHGLVTSNMQEQVEQNTDSGRCTVCGRAYANKLVQHMKEVHKSNLKPAHLSYKCTVCSATFNLYRLFENHVYSVHSDSVKRSGSESGIKNMNANKKTKIEFTKDAPVSEVNTVITDHQYDANSNNVQASIKL